MARAPRGDETTAAEQVVHQIEAHEDRVAEKMLGQVYAILKESLGALEVRIEESTQTQAYAASKAVEEKVGSLLIRHTETLMQATSDAASRLQHDLSTAMAAQQKEIGTMLDAHTAATAQQIKDGGTALGTHFDQKIDALVPQLRDMLNTTEVSVLAKLLALIDARLKAIEARLAGYASPEQEAEASAENKRLADAKTAQAARLSEIAATATTEAAKATDHRTRDEYEYLALRAKDLAAQAQREAAELLA